MFLTRGRLQGVVAASFLKGVLGNVKHVLKRYSERPDAPIKRRGTPK